MSKSQARDSAVVSYTMSRIRGKDTSIEVKLRKALWKEGLRYRKNYKKAAGTPDIALVKTKIAIFCDSSFWHGHNWRNKKKTLRTNREFWIKKIERNIERDSEVNEKLRQEEWLVLRFWDFEINKSLSEVTEQIVTAHKRRLVETGADGA